MLTVHKFIELILHMQPTTYSLAVFIFICML